MYIKINVPQKEGGYPNQFLIGLYIRHNRVIKVLCPQKGLQTKCEIEVRNGHNMDLGMVEAGKFIRIATPENADSTPILESMEPYSVPNKGIPNRSTYKKGIKNALRRECQAERVWNLVAGQVSSDTYSPQETNLVKDEWNEGPECVKLWNNIESAYKRVTERLGISDPFWEDTDLRTITASYEKMMHLLAIKMFEYGQILSGDW